MTSRNVHFHALTTTIVVEDASTDEEAVRRAVADIDTRCMFQMTGCSSVEVFEDDLLVSEFWMRCENGEMVSLEDVTCA